MGIYEEYEEYEDYDSAEFSQPISNRQKQLEEFVKEHKHEWWITGQQGRIARESINITHYELAKCLGVSPSVILAFEEGNPVQRPRFVENAYRTALIAFFYSYRYSENEHYPNHLYPTSTFRELVANLCHCKKLSLDEVSELVKIFKFSFRVQEDYNSNSGCGSVNFYDNDGAYLFTVDLKEEV